MKKINLNLFLQISIFFISIILYYISNHFRFENALMLVSWGVNIHFLVTVVLLYRKTNNIFDYNIVFLIILFIYNHGQTLLYSLGLDTSNYSTFKHATYDEILSTTIYYYFSQIAFVTGMLLSMSPKEKKTKAEMAFSPLRISKKNIRTCGIILFLLSVLPYSYYLTKSVQTSISYGYTSLYSENAIRLPGIIMFATYFFIPSIILLAYSSKNKKRATILMSIVFSFLSATWFMTGYRGRAIVPLVILLCFINDHYKAFKAKSLLKISLAFVFIVILIPTIYNFRLLSNKSPEAFFDELSYSITKENPLEDTLREVGGTNYAYILTHRIIPSRYNYKLGESYLASVLMIIPSNLFGGYSFANKANLDTWLMKESSLSYGPGFSITAETYYNFGTVFGILFTVVLGFFYGFFLNRWKKFKNTEMRGLQKVLSLIFLECIMLAARSPFHSTIRYLLFIYFGIYFIIYFVSRRRQSLAIDQQEKYGEINEEA